MEPNPIVAILSQMVTIWVFFGIGAIGFAFIGKIPFGWDPAAVAKFFFVKPLVILVKGIHGMAKGIFVWMLGDRLAKAVGLKKKKKKK